MVPSRLAVHALIRRRKCLCTTPICLNGPARRATLAFLVPPLERNGYPLRQEGSDALVFGHSSRGTRISVRFRDLGDRRTLVLVHGAAPLGVRRAFARLDE